MSLVFFDFDGTLTRQDTILPFGFFLAQGKRSKYLRMVHLIALVILLKLRVVSNHKFKERFCSAFLRGRSEKEIESLSRVFADRYLDGILNTPVVEALRNHQQEGDEVYLVSSNFAFLLRPLQLDWALSGVIATDPEIAAGRLTGRISGQACDGREKLSRVLALFGREHVREATAYGDSRGDRHLLAAVKRAVWV